MLTVCLRVPSQPRSQTVNISSMTNTNSYEYCIKTPDDGQYVCLKHAEFFTKIKLRNSAYCWFLWYEYITTHGPLNVKPFPLVSSQYLSCCISHSLTWSVLKCSSEPQTGSSVYIHSIFKSLCLVRHAASSPNQYKGQRVHAVWGVICICENRKRINTVRGQMRRFWCCSI
jgi:hypothetical protein